MNQDVRITLVLVESQRLIRDALRALLENTEEIEVVGEAADADDLAGLVEARRPDVVLLSMDAWDDRELAFLELLPRLPDGTRSLLVTSQTDVDLHGRAIELGAMGIVLKTQPAQVLVKAVRKVHAGELWLDRAEAADLVGRLTRRRIVRESDSSRIESLTARERHIVARVSEGLKNKDIAARLAISEATVRNHLTSILDKLGLSNRFQLAVYAFRKGLVACPQVPAILRHVESAGPDRSVRLSSRTMARPHSALTG